MRNLPWMMASAILDGMSEGTLTVDKAGRVVLPKPLRDRLRLRPGSRLDVVATDGGLLLTPVEQGPDLVREGEWWVSTGRADPGSSLAEAVADDRAARLDELSR